MVIRRMFRYVGIAIICLVFVVVSSAMLYRTYLQHRVAEKRAITSLHGVDSLEAVRIGGIDQWIEERGQDLDNPILLFIRGGPGVAFIPLAGAFQAHGRNTSRWCNGISGEQARPTSQMTKTFSARL
jgi:hypothetical protein